LPYECKCKICSSEQAENIEFCRYFLDWPYDIIVDVFNSEIDNLNSYNLSTHFNRHTDIKTKRFLRDIREAELQRRGEYVVKDKNGRFIRDIYSLHNSG